MTEKTINSRKGMKKLRTEDQEDYADEPENPRMMLRRQGKREEAERKYGRTEN